jgi:hypothetical protein
VTVPGRLAEHDPVTRQPKPGSLVLPPRSPGFGGTGVNSDDAREDAERHARQILGKDAVIAVGWKPGMPARLIRYDPATGGHGVGEAGYPAVVTGNDGEFVTATYDAGHGPGTGGPLYFDQAGHWLAFPDRWRLNPAATSSNETATTTPGTENQALKWTIGQEVTLAECDPATGKPKPGGRTVTGTVADMENVDQADVVAVDAPGLPPCKTFLADTGLAWLDDPGWCLLTGEEAAPAAGEGN